jgi:hypothetical protein
VLLLLLLPLLLLLLLLLLLPLLLLLLLLLLPLLFRVRPAPECDRESTAPWQLPPPSFPAFSLLA